MNKNMSSEVSIVKALVEKLTEEDVAVLTVCKFDESNPELVPWEIGNDEDRSRFMDWHEVPHLVARVVTVESLEDFDKDEDLVDGWQWYVAIVDGVAHDVWQEQLDGYCPDYMGGDIDGASEWANEIV